MQYYAKSKNQSGRQATVKEHLSAVSLLAKENAGLSGLSEAAALAGNIHDFGKYSLSFQRVLLGEESGIDHAVSGALYLEACTKGHAGFHAVMEAVNGHHHGLVEYTALKPILHAIAAEKAGTSGNDGKKPSIRSIQELKNANEAFRQDFPEFVLPRLTAFTGTQLESMLYTRMLFSCLVDADYSASAQDDDPTYIARTAGTPLQPLSLLENLYKYRDNIRRNSNADSSLNQYRDSVFQQCGEMGKHAEGLFTLTAPTGTGKTLALLHFALQHCLTHQKNRIIIVLPFLTLAEQNAAVYSQIIPDVLVDHSQSDLSEASRELAARWSAPVIITTSVRFFESLFSDQPGACRKLHHIANSVVVFDEAQSLPADITSSTLQTVNALCESYHTSMVFSTATQPDYSALQHLKWQPCEILPNNALIFQVLQRVDVDWRIKLETPLSDIASEMAAQNSVCAIVNLRRHARSLVEAITALCASDEVFYLTTDLCPAHRSKVIQDIHSRMKKKLPCRVVATQCIEAGVDLDFDVLYRSLAPLDSIIQAAGRCNRNGRLRRGHVIVFRPEDRRDPYPDAWYANAALTVREMDPPFSIDDPDNIRNYYRRLFTNASDKTDLQSAIESRSFSGTASAYKLIPNTGMQIIVPFTDEQERYARIALALREKGVTGYLLKEAAPITVTSFAKNLDDFAERILYANCPDSTNSNVFLLRPQFEHLYSDNIGLYFPKEEINDYIF